MMHTAPNIRILQFMNAGVGLGSSGEEGPDEGEDEEDDGCHVERQAEFTQGKAAWEELFVTPPLQRNARDGANVRGQNRHE